jgi:hypothetical protein
MIAWLFLQVVYSYSQPLDFWRNKDYENKDQGSSPAEATRLWFDEEKSRLHFHSWRVVIASWSRWWEKRHYELKVRPVGDCKVISFLIESQSRRLSGRSAEDKRRMCSNADSGFLLIKKCILCEFPFITDLNAHTTLLSALVTNGLDTAWGRNYCSLHFVNHNTTSIKALYCCSSFFLMSSLARTVHAT